MNHILKHKDYFPGPKYTRFTVIIICRVQECEQFYDWEAAEQGDTDNYNITHFTNLCKIQGKRYALCNLSQVCLEYLVYNSHALEKTFMLRSNEKQTKHSTMASGHFFRRVTRIITMRSQTDCLRLHEA